MSTESLRRVVEPSAPPMSDVEFRAQLGRHSSFLDNLKSPAQKKKTSQHPDIARAVANVETAFRAAYAAFGANDADVYHHALVSVRRAVGAWGTVNGQHGEITWRPTVK